MPSENALETSLPARPVASRMPDTYLILLAVALLAFALTHVLPSGQFEVQDVTYTQGTQEVTRQVVDPESFRYPKEGAIRGLPVFAAEGEIGLLNFVFEGLVSGTKWGAAVGVMVFILITGGAFGIILATGAIDHGLRRVIQAHQSREAVFIPLLFFLFSLGGAVFGMGEEAIPFTLIVVPILVSLGYDSITGVMVTYVATQVGFAASWMNPFGVTIAQGIANVPLLSGAPFRITMWILFTLVGMAYTVMYARRIRAAPECSAAYVSDAVFRHEHDALDPATSLRTGHWLIFAIVGGGLVWIIWGVVSQGYYLPELATQFFTMGLAAGVVGVVFGLGGMTANGAAAAFRDGATQLLPAAMVVGLAKGIVLMLGGDDPAAPSVLNTLLHHAAQGVTELPSGVAAWCMYLVQSVFNIFVTSGSGQAALTMPLMAPLSDLVGVSRQTAVLAFQLGDGFTNIVVPTSASLMGCLGAARLEWTVWIRFALRFQFLLMALASLWVLVAVAIGF